MSSMLDVCNYSSNNLISVTNALLKSYNKCSAIKYALYAHILLQSTTTCAYGKYSAIGRQKKHSTLHCAVIIATNAVLFICTSTGDPPSDLI